MLIAMFLLMLLNPPTHRVVVTNGTGSGVYPVGKRVRIAAVAPREHSLSQWSAYPDDTTIVNFHQLKTYVVVPAHDVTITAMFLPDPPKRTH
jgi:hypothetical protein